jgi:mRNA-degrading endonuclease RelE of RelBE toxin-antitoxin system
MKSATLPSFWAEYRKLSEPIRERARKNYRLWADNPFHPSLHFKCIDSKEGIWSVRVTRSYRAVGILEGDTVTWFWIGSHDDYEQFYS